MGTCKLTNTAVCGVVVGAGGVSSTKVYQLSSIAVNCVSTGDMLKCCLNLVPVYLSA
jgi:hypothetical protein